MKTGKHSKNQFNPMFGRSAFQAGWNAPQRDYDSIKIRQDYNKYQYVVDWQIETEDQPPIPEGKFKSDLPD
ncbi:MAG: hypothetical protein ACOZDD_13245, partial [Bacteroidota bacterium]